MNETWTSDPRDFEDPSELRFCNGKDLDQRPQIGDDMKRNIFRRKFLTSLSEHRNDVPTLCEALTAGPWNVSPVTHGGRTEWALRRESDSEPLARLRFWETALLLAAVLPGSGRHPLYALRPKGNKSELVTSFGEQGFTRIGELELLDTEILTHLHTAHCLLASQESLAWLLMAAPPQTLERAGQIVAQRLRALEPGDSPDVTR